MRFTNVWGEGEIFKWYQDRKQKSTRSTAVKSLQVRIDRGGIPHRFVLICTQDEAWLRFDRRPKDANPAILIRETAGAPRRIAADDLCEVGDKQLAEIEASISCEINMILPPDTDLLWVISICFAMFNDDQARYYDLFKYNCYFFSWTILLVLTRHALPFSVPSPETVIQSLREDLGVLSNSLTKKTIHALLSIVLNVITSVRDETGSRIKAGMSPAGRLVWKLPLGFMHFILQQALKIQMYMGLEQHMQTKTKERVLELCQSLLKDAWDNRDLTDPHVERRLWIQGLIGDIKPALEVQVAYIIWDGILDIIASVHGKVNGQNEIDRIEHNLVRRSCIKSRLFGDIQWVQVWNEALSTALPVARDAAHGKAQEIRTSSSGQPGSTTYTQLHAEVFDIAFGAACDAALNAAKRVATETQEQHKNPKRADMWETIWGLWDKIWALAQLRLRGSVFRETAALLDIVRIQRSLGDPARSAHRIGCVTGVAKRAVLNKLADRHVKTWGKMQRLDRSPAGEDIGGNVIRGVMLPDFVKDLGAPNPRQYALAIVAPFPQLRYHQDADLVEYRLLSGNYASPEVIDAIKIDSLVGHVVDRSSYIVERTSVVGRLDMLNITVNPE
ncbi:hypothetical protein RSOL_359880, partial [Rhizoctonia solani AG-3 Rhs1AP]